MLRRDGAWGWDSWVVDAFEIMDPIPVALHNGAQGSGHLVRVP